MAYKIAVDAGHGLSAAGRRCLKSIDPNETGEWQLNSRIAGYVTEHLKAAGVQTLRTDDITGEIDVSLSGRCRKANAFGADLLISIHANAGINGGSGGGIMVYALPNASQSTKEWQEDTWRQTVAETGLRGNRCHPLSYANLTILQHASMPALLCECGFMDSTVDTPVILTDGFARKCARSIANAALKRLALYKNGSGVKPVYADANRTSAIGSLNPDETCRLMGTCGNSMIVLYEVTSGAQYYPADRNYKVGFIN